MALKRCTRPQLTALLESASPEESAWVRGCLPGNPGKAGKKGEGRTFIPGHQGRQIPGRNRKLSELFFELQMKFFHPQVLLTQGLAPFKA